MHNELGTENVKEEKKSFQDKFEVNKIATIDMNEKSMSVSTGGISYRYEDKYGIMTFDGKHDTGAIYSYCTPKKNFFMVVTDLPKTEDLTIENINRVGVVDSTGKTIVPEKYASVDVLNERYIKVCEATEKTDSNDDALVYYTERLFSLTANEEDILFKGKWYVFDAETGEKVKGVTGTKAYSVNAYGNYIEFRTDDGEKKCVNEKGEVLPDKAKLFDDGSYVIEEDKRASLYDKNGNKLFDYLTEDFQIINRREGESYFTARKNVENKNKYVIVDEKGAVVSAEFDEVPNIYGESLFVDDKLYDFEGNVVCEGQFKRAYFDKFTRNAVMLTTENDDVTIIKDGKTVLAQFNGDDVSVGSDFTANKKVGGEKKYYSFKDEDYILKGTSYGPWVVKTNNEDGSSNLVDTISGEVLMSNYYDITDGTVVDSVLYAFGENKDGTVDVYAIK